MVESLVGSDAARRQSLSTARGVIFFANVFVYEYSRDPAKMPRALPTDDVQSRSATLRREAGALRDPGLVRE